MHSVFSVSAACATFAVNRLPAPSTIPGSPPPHPNPAHALAPTPPLHPTPPSHPPTHSTQYDTYMALHTHPRTASTRVYTVGSPVGHAPPPSTRSQ